MATIKVSTGGGSATMTDLSKILTFVEAHRPPKRTSINTKAGLAKWDRYWGAHAALNRLLAQQKMVECVARILARRANRGTTGHR